MWTTLLFIPFILTGFVAIGYANVTAADLWAGINLFTLWNCIPLPDGTLARTAGSDAPIEKPRP